MSLEVTIIDHFTCTSLVDILSIKPLCVVVNLLFVCETWQSGWKKLVSESGEGETRKLWISFNSLSHSLHLIRTKTYRFSVVKILENI